MPTLSYLPLSVLLACTPKRGANPAPPTTPAEPTDTGHEPLPNDTGTPPKAPDTSDSGTVPAPALRPSEPMFMTEPFSTGLEAWSEVAQAFLDESPADFVGFSRTTCGYWETIGPANTGDEWTAEGMLETCSERYDYILATGGPSQLAGLDVEGTIVGGPRYASRTASDYDDRLRATKAVVEGFVERYGPGSKADLPVGWYGSAVGGSYYVSLSDVQSFRSTAYPKGYAFTDADLDTFWRGATFPLVLLGGYVSDAHGVNNFEFTAFDDPASPFSPGLGDFLLDYAKDNAVAAFDQPDWQPILRALDSIEPSLYANDGWPDVLASEQLRATDGDMKGLGGDSTIAYYMTRRSAEWAEAQTDRERRVIPYVSGELFFGSGSGTFEDHYGGTREVWDEGWVEKYSQMWTNNSNTHVTTGQARLRYHDFENLVEGVRRGALDGGQPAYGIYYWEPWGYSLASARSYLEDREGRSSMRDYFLAVRRVALHEYAIEMPDDPEVLDPLFGGHYDRVGVWGPFLKDETEWTVADLDAAIPLLWKVRVLPYLQITRDTLLE